MGRIPQTFIDELIARSDIVEVIGARVQLKKAGREYKACCPFHSEKTPSFWVSPEKQFYHCFGCGAHGTVLGFLMEHDRMSFPEAVEELAARLGLEVPREGGSDGEARRPEESLYELMGRVAGFYVDCLARDERARQYLARRGLTRQIIERFQIGYAPDSWNEVLKHFGTSDQSRRQLAELGLIVERERGAPRDGERHYDRFRDRIMFPIRDARGRVIAFGGRVLDQGEPKYLNSPETTLFHKGRELYGLYEVRQSRAPLRRLLVVEGYMDTVRLHQFGIPYAVATLGTATTPEHFKRIFRLVSEVVFAFDGDRAGRTAAWRALQHALPEAREGREIRFLFLPEGHDPDSLVGEEGREAFERRLEAALPLSEYLVRALAEQADLSHADGRARFAEAARPLVARVPEGVYRELLLARIAETIRLSPQRLQELWGGSGRPAEAPTSAPPRPPLPARRRTSAGRGGLVRQAVKLLVHFPELAGRLQPEKVEALLRLETPGAQFLNGLINELRARPARTTAQVLERWRDRPEGEKLARLAAEENLVPDAAAGAKELDTALDRLLEEAGRQRIDRLLEKDRALGLTAEEKLELQGLMTKLSGPRPSSGRP